MFVNITSPNLGGTGLETLIPLAQIPGVIAEWAALIPLVCHLATYGHDFQLAGEASLTGRLSVGLFPKLGVTGAIARFLEHGPDFVERTAVQGSSTQEVWDVNWGSTFPCANGAACTILTEFALRRRSTPIKMPEIVKPKAKRGRDSVQAGGRDGGGSPSQSSASTVTTEENSTSNSISPTTLQTGSQPAEQCANGHSQSHPGTPAPNQAVDSIFRRFQELHVIEFSRGVVTPSWNLKISRLLSSLHFEILSTVFLLGVVVLLCLCALYGSATMVLSASISKVAAHLSVLHRPVGFLTNNEKHDACMLGGAHPNCTSWYLYIGDRGLVDYLLNKPMIQRDKPSIWLYGWFKIAHIVQLLAMTYVAAQKGWDGIATTILMVASLALSWQFGHRRMARNWLESFGIVLKTRSFQFGGRTQMIATIQSFNGGKCTSWMNSILAPCTRRETLFSRLEIPAEAYSPTEALPSEGSKQEALSQFDEDWVALQVELAREATIVMKQELQREEQI